MQNNSEMSQEKPKTIFVDKKEGFLVNCSDYSDNAMLEYSRKDFYKVCLFMGECIIDYADRGIHVNGTTLFFGTPHIPYAWEDIAKVRSYSCLFTEEFLKTNNNSESLQQSPLFKIGGTPIFNLDEKQAAYVTEIFEKMVASDQIEYTYKSDLIRNYINLIIHEALQIQPASNYSKPNSASSRVTSMFMELLERQFPVDIPNNHLQLKTANDYAKGLAVHVNHLNRSLKEITGKSTSMHIADRIITEAKSLLRHTDLSIAEIAYGLGFEYPSYFNNYFKRYTNSTPLSYRE